MTSSLEQELKEFEKQLSLLLVRFMKIHDQLEASKAAQGSVRPGPVPPPSPEMPKPPRADPAVAYS